MCVCVCEDETISGCYRLNVSVCFIFPLSVLLFRVLILLFLSPPRVCIPLQMLCNNVSWKNYSFVSWQHSAKEKKHLLSQKCLIAHTYGCKKWKRVRYTRVDRIIFPPIQPPCLMHFNSFAHGQRVHLLRSSLAWKFSTPSVVLIYVFIVFMCFNLKERLYRPASMVHIHPHCLHPLQRNEYYNMHANNVSFPFLFQFILFGAHKFNLINFT